MPNLVQQGLRIQDVQSKRTRFKHIRIGQIFYVGGRWYQKRTSMTAIPADEPSDDKTRFKFGKWIRVFDETAPPYRPLTGLSYDEFMSDAAL